MVELAKHRFALGLNADQLISNMSPCHRPTTIISHQESHTSTICAQQCPLPSEGSSDETIRGALCKGNKRSQRLWVCDKIQSRVARRSQFRQLLSDVISLETSDDPLKIVSTAKRERDGELPSWVRGNPICVVRIAHTVVSTIINYSILLEFVVRHPVNLSLLDVASF